jgi:hypothetical protein
MRTISQTHFFDNLRELSFLMKLVVSLSSKREHLVAFEEQEFKLQQSFILVFVIQAIKSSSLFSLTLSPVTPY